MALVRWGGMLVGVCMSRGDFDCDGHLLGGMERVWRGWMWGFCCGVLSMC